MQDNVGLWWAPKSIQRGDGYSQPPTSNTQAQLCLTKEDHVAIRCMPFAECPRQGPPVRPSPPLHELRCMRYGGMRYGAYCRRRILAGPVPWDPARAAGEGSCQIPAR